jgi:two-component system LytT family sensor kinase
MFFLMRARKAWLIVAGVWTILGVLAASQHIAFRAYSGWKFDAGQVFGRTMLSWYTCGIFTPVIFLFARRFRLDSSRWRLTLPIHLAACVVFILVKLALYLPLASALGWYGEPANFVQALYGDVFPLTITYASVVGASYAVDYYKRYQERAVRAAELESRLTRVQLDALRAQVHPHFLFNALNALSTLIHRDPAAADRMVLELGDLLRQTLNSDAPVEVSLREELQFVKRYLSIMQTRFGERLRVSYDIEEDALQAYVPNMVLQPLVENALLHGIGKTTDAGELVLRARRVGASLELQVSDDGPGMSGHASGERIGLRNTRALLESLYGQEQSLLIRNGDGRGVTVCVRIPFHEGPLNQ